MKVPSQKQAGEKVLMEILQSLGGLIIFYSEAGVR